MPCSICQANPLVSDGADGRGVYGPLISRRMIPLVRREHRIVVVVDWRGGGEIHVIDISYGPYGGCVAANNIVHEGMP